MQKSMHGEGWRDGKRELPDTFLPECMHTALVVELRTKGD